jgi:hypothetical protein
MKDVGDVQAMRLGADLLSLKEQLASASRTIEEEQALAVRFQRENEALRAALDVIPVELMLAVGPPYRVTFTKAAAETLAAAKK